MWTHVGTSDKRETDIFKIVNKKFVVRDRVNKILCSIVADHDSRFSILETVRGIYFLNPTLELTLGLGIRGMAKKQGNHSVLNKWVIPNYGTNVSV